MPAAVNCVNRRKSQTRYIYDYTPGYDYWKSYWSGWTNSFILQKEWSTHYLYSELQKTFLRSFWTVRQGRIYLQAKRMSRHYLSFEYRPLPSLIIRGKEAKSVEFRPKVNNHTDEWNLVFRTYPPFRRLLTEGVRLKRLYSSPTTTDKSWVKSLYSGLIYANNTSQEILY